MTTVDLVGGSTRRRKAHPRAWTTLAVLMLLVLSFTVAPQSADAATRVCAPSGRCVSAVQTCNPGTSCARELFREVPTGQYCAPSVGCFPWKGKNYRYVGGPATTQAQRESAMKCASSLGVTWLGGVAGGPIGVTILGVAVSLWGRSS